ncbi:MAG: hypothetical protein AAF662_10045 [Pseudomonadota bacterium]
MAPWTAVHNGHCHLSVVQIGPYKMLEPDRGLERIPNHIFKSQRHVRVASGPVIDNPIVPFDLLAHCFLINACSQQRRCNRVEKLADAFHLLSSIALQSDYLERRNISVRGVHMRIDQLYCFPIKLMPRDASNLAGLKCGPLSVAGHTASLQHLHNHG